MDGYLGIAAILTAFLVPTFGFMTFMFNRHDAKAKADRDEAREMREEARKERATQTVMLQTVVAKVEQVEHATNGMKKELEDQARREGRAEGHQDAVDEAAGRGSR